MVTDELKEYWRRKQQEYRAKKKREASSNIINKSKEVEKK
jgi:hypothetical protein